MVSNPKSHTGKSSEDLVLMETHAILTESGKPQKPPAERETKARSGDMILPELPPTASDKVLLSLLPRLSLHPCVSVAPCIGLLSRTMVPTAIPSRFFVGLCCCCYGDRSCCAVVYTALQLVVYLLPPPLCQRERYVPSCSPYKLIVLFFFQDTLVLFC